MNRKTSRINCLRSVVGLLAMGLSFAALGAAQSSEVAKGQVNYFPTYAVGPQNNGTWVVSDGAIISPAGTQVNLGIRVRAKAVALNPKLSTNTAAVLTMGTSLTDGNGAVEIFDVNTGAVLQNYSTFGLDPTGSYAGLSYSKDGQYLAFSQDSSWVTIAKVNTTTGLLWAAAAVASRQRMVSSTDFLNASARMVDHLRISRRRI